MYIYIFQDEKCRLLRNLSFIYVHDAPWKDGNVRFTNVPLITLSDQVWIRIDIKVFFESLIYIFITLLKWLAHFLFNRSNGEAHRQKHFFKSWIKVSSGAKDPHWKQIDPDPGYFHKIFWFFLTKQNFQIFCYFCSPIFML